MENRSSITEYINTIERERANDLKKASKTLKKILISTQEELNKAIDGAKKLIEETDPQLTEEGIKKIRKKGKMYFRSLKAINSYSHFCNEKLKDLVIPDKDDELSYADLKQLTRSISKILSDLDKERVVTDRIMGLDFMLKKRKLYDPLSKIHKNLKNLRELMNNEYSLIKIIEDLTGIEKEIADLTEKISKNTSEIKTLETDLDEFHKNLDKIITKIEELERSDVLQRIRKINIRKNEIEIEIGKHLNSYKKTFKKFYREAQRGSISTDFQVIGAALKYSEKPVQNFLEENDENIDILRLLEAVIPIGIKKLGLKQGNINSMKNEKKQIEKGSLNKLRDEWKSITNEKEKLTITNEYKNTKKKIDSLIAEKELLEEKIANIKETLSIKKRELEDNERNLKERLERSQQLYQEAINNK